MKRIFFALCAVALLVSCDPVEDQPKEVYYGMLVSQIKSTLYDSGEVDGVSKCEFYYGAKDVVDRIVFTDATGMGKSGEINFNYGGDEVAYVYTVGEEDVASMSCKLSAGCMVSSVYESREVYDGEVYDEKMLSTYSYKDGYLVKCVTVYEYEGESDTYEYALNWAGNNLTSVSWDGELDRVEYSNMSNNPNIDLNWFLIYAGASEGLTWCTGDGDHIFAALGYAGKRSWCTVKNQSSTDDPMLVKYEYTFNEDKYPIVIEEWTKDLGDTSYAKTAVHEITYVKNTKN